MPTTQAFEKADERLNTAQKQAVEAIEGPVMVIAGPGTGKTQILTLRIGNILRKTDVGPDAILALTFTESGAASMRERLLSLVGEDAYRVPIHTFHGFAERIIAEYPDAFPNIIGGRLIDDVEKIALMREILDEGGFKIITPFGNPYFYIDALMRSVSELKREDISPDAFEKRIADSRATIEGAEDLYHEKGAHAGKMKGAYAKELERLEKNQELVRAYRRYEERLREMVRFDFEDQILETVRLLERDEAMRLALQERFQYILADEHQDANHSQNRLLELLSSFHENPNLFVVGDEKQAIFRFQGASLENFLYFKEKYPNALVITLTDNYRSTQRLLDAAHGMIARPGPASDLRVPLKSAANNDGRQIEVRACANDDAERAGIASEIASLLKNGVEAGEVAVLVRKNRETERIADALARKGVPHRVISDRNVLAEGSVRAFVLLLRALESFGDDRHLAPLIHQDFWKLDRLDLFKALSYARRERMSIYDVIRSERALNAAGVENSEPFIAIYRLLADFAALSSSESLPNVLDAVVHQSGLIAWTLTRSDGQDQLAALHAFFQDATARAGRARDYRLSDLVRHLDDAEEHGVSLSRRPSARSDSVSVMTAHRSKGLEYRYVFVPGATDRSWGDSRGRELFRLDLGPMRDAEEDDERRLLYVAITRGKEQVALSYAKTDAQGKEQLPSRFIAEIDPALIEESTPAASSELLIQSPRPHAALSVTEKSYLNELFLEQGLSVTALNNFIRSPWQYFFGNLLRVPQAQNNSLMFGTAMDRTLKRFSDMRAASEEVSKEQLLEMFEREVRAQPFAERDLLAARERGREALSGYFDTYQTDTTDAKSGVAITTSIAVEGLPVPEITIRGEIDRLEMITDEEVRVVDFKTGKQKSRADIEGKTKSSDGNYKRQLIFYKLLLASYEEGEYRMNEGVIDFVEPDEKGRFRREAFAISDEEVEGLKGLIRETAKNIYDLSFWNEVCDPETCDYCELVEAIKKKG